MSSNKPLEYGSLKVVLQYMEADVRYKLSSRIPSIRVAEKALPVRFDKLVFNVLETQVNDTIYRLRLFFKYPDGHEMSTRHREHNERGGYHYDFTEHGFETHLRNHAPTPGDVKITSIDDERVLWGEGQVFDRGQLFFERHIEVYERALAMRLERGDDGTINDESKYMEVDERLKNERIDPVDRANIETHLLEILVPFSAEKLRSSIKDFRDDLVPYRCRQNNTPLPYTHVIQLAVKTPGGTLIYRHPYNLKLQEAMKKINTALFGGRKCTHHVRSLHLMHPNMVIRLPDCFRIRIQEMRARGIVSKNYESLKAIVDESSYPLDVLIIEHEKIKDVDYNYQITKGAKKLIIELQRGQIGVFLPILRNLQNPNVYLRCQRSHFPVEDQVALIKHWIDTKRSVGTFLSYEVEGMVNIEKFRRFIEYVGSRSGDNSFTIPTTNDINIEVKCVPLDNPGGYWKNPSWRVEMQVVDRIEQDVLDFL